MLKTIIEKILHRHPCFRVWTISLSLLAPREKEFFDEFAPVSQTAIILGHHIITKAEWTWHINDDGSEHCDADDHAANVCEQLKYALEKHGFPTEIVTYPGESGLQFRFVAQAAGAGEIGINAFLLHPRWGPWIHLRVLVTDAISKVKTFSHPQVCNACGICTSECPAGAIRHGSFDGLLCRSYRQAKGEYVPFGLERELRYCTICASCCPVGRKPI